MKIQLLFRPVCLYLSEDPKPQRFCHRLKMALYSKTQNTIFVCFNAKFTKASLDCGASTAPVCMIQTKKKKKAKKTKKNVMK